MAVGGVDDVEVAPFEGAARGRQGRRGSQAFVEVMGVIGAVVIVIGTCQDDARNGGGGDKGEGGGLHGVRLGARERAWWLYIRIRRDQYPQMRQGAGIN